MFGYFRGPGRGLRRGQGMGRRRGMGRGRGMGLGRGWRHGFNLNVTQWSNDRTDIIGNFVGGVQQMTAKARVNEERCKGCGICANVCRTGAIRVVNGVAKVDVKKCIGCGDCVAVCPQNAISLVAD